MKAVASPVFSAVCTEGPGESRVLVDLAEPVFAGHYPNFPIFPGVCIVESAHRGALAEPPVPGLRLAAVESVRFLRPVFPGDEIVAVLSWVRRNNGWRCSASAATNGEPVAQIRLRYEEEAHS